LRRASTICGLAADKNRGWPGQARAMTVVTLEPTI